MTEAPRERILQAVAARLAAITGVDGLKVERERPASDPVTDQSLPLLVLYDAGQQPAEGYTNEYAYTLAAQIEGWIAGRAPNPAADGGAARAVLEAKVMNALLAGDQSLGGLVRGVQPADEQQPQRLAAAAAPEGVWSFTLTFAIDYAVSDQDALTLLV